MIRQKMKHFTLTKGVDQWLDTGQRRLHKVLGSKHKGIPYGRIFEIYGKESNGKTALAMEIAGLAQRDGADYAHVDLENCWDDQWARNRGVEVVRSEDGEEVLKPALFKPYVGMFGGERRKPQLISAEALLDEVETWMYDVSRTNNKIVVLIDSVTALLAEKEASGGLTEQNMSTRTGGLPQFMGQLLRRWVGLAGTYNAMIIFINQTRTAPVRFGNPEYTPGGNALKFYASVRIKMTRKARMRNGKKIIGIKGMIANIKNKAGGGSVEGEEAGYKIFFSKPTKFLSEEDMKEELKFKGKEKETEHGDKD